MNAPKWVWWLVGLIVGVPIVLFLISTVFGAVMVGTQAARMNEQRIADSADFHSRTPLNRIGGIG